jgi:hypothetical protein
MVPKIQQVMGALYIISEYDYFAAFAKASAFFLRFNK